MERSNNRRSNSRNNRYRKQSRSNDSPYESETRSKDVPYNQRPDKHRVRMGRGSGTKGQVEGAKHNPWLEHVAEVRNSREAEGLSQPEILQLARQSYRPKRY